MRLLRFPCVANVEKCRRKMLAAISLTVVFPEDPATVTTLHDDNFERHNLAISPKATSVSGTMTWGMARTDSIGVETMSAEAPAASACSQK
jgi:hypothetical protein